MKVLLNIWHKQLGYAIICSVLKLWNLSMVTEIEMMGNAPDDTDGECKTCLKKKTTQNIILKKSDIENPSVSN